MRCPDCGAENSSDRRFCMECGASLSRPCPACAFVNSLDARFCGGCGVALDTAPPSAPAEASAAAGGEIRPVVILFTDICGFTRLSASLGAEETHALLGRFFEAVDAVVERYRGTIDKHIGDCAMAIFGAPVAHSNDPERAIRAALDIPAAVGHLGPASGPPLEVHAGIASGQVVAGATGSERRQDYTVTGDSVNLAARLLEAAGPGEVLISEAVHQALSETVAVAPARTIEAKGFDAPVKTWRVEGFRGAGGSQRPFVGRNSELRQLTGAIGACAESGTGSVVYIRGDAGIGKTRMVERAQAEAADRGFDVLTGLNLDFGVAAGQDAIGSIVRAAIGAEGTEADALRRAADRALGDLVGPDRAVFLNDLLDLPQPPALRSDYDAMDTATRAQGRRDTVAELVRRVSERKPLLICVEDLHWAEPGMLAHLAALVGAIHDRPVLVVMTSRIEGDPIDPSWRAAAGPASLMTIDLGPLREAEASEMAASLVDPSQSYAAACIARAAGNPLFLEQLLRNAEQAAAETVPASVQAVVLARVDRLPAADRQALQAASILGQRFTLAALRSVLGDPGYRCDPLIEHYLVRPEGDGFLFSHALVQEGIYASLLSARRTELHGRAAAWYAEHDRILHAEHLERAGDDAAARAYRDAAEAEWNAYRTERALQLIERGLAIAQDRGDRFELTCVKGEILQDLGDAPASIETFETAVEMAADEAERCRALIGLAGGLRVIDQHERALELLDQAEPMAEAKGMTAEMARLCHLRGNLFFTLGNIEGCRRQHERALDLAREVGSPELEARALGGVADASYADGRLVAAFDQFQKCVTVAQEHGFGRIEVANRSMVAFTQLMTVELHGALEQALAAIAAAQRVGHGRAETIAHHCAHQALLLLGDLDRAAVHSERARELAVSLGSKRFEAEALAFLAEVRRAEGRPSEALDLLHQGLDISRATGMSYIGPTILAAIAVVTDDAEERGAVLAEGEALLAEGSLSHNHIYFYRDAIDACLRARDWAGAERYADALVAYTQTEPMPWTDFLIARCRAFARHGRGERDAALTEELERLREQACSADLRLMLPDFEDLLARE